MNPSCSACSFSSTQSDLRARPCAVALAFGEPCPLPGIAWAASSPLGQKGHDSLLARALVGALALACPMRRRTPRSKRPRTVRSASGRNSPRAICCDFRSGRVVEWRAPLQKVRPKSLGWSLTCPTIWPTPTASTSSRGIDQPSGNEGIRRRPHLPDLEKRAVLVNQVDNAPMPFMRGRRVGASRSRRHFPATRPRRLVSCGGVRGKVSRRRGRHVVHVGAEGGAWSRARPRAHRGQRWRRTGLEPRAREKQACRGAPRTSASEEQSRNIHKPSTDCQSAA